MTTAPPSTWGGRKKQSDDPPGMVVGQTELHSANGISPASAETQGKHARGTSTGSQDPLFASTTSPLHRPASM